MPFFEQKIDEMYDEDWNSIESAPHPQQILKIKTDRPVRPDYILRKRKEQDHAY